MVHDRAAFFDCFSFHHLGIPGPGRGADRERAPAGGRRDNPPLLILSTSFGMTFFTELTSNTAISELVLPIIASASAGMSLNPLLLMIPATVSASCAFMLPVATPPNAIIFGSGKVPMGKMVQAGIVLNLVGCLLILLLVYLLVIPVFNIDPGVMPSWASVSG